jgi:hypothetical protein
MSASRIIRTGRGRPIWCRFSDAVKRTKPAHARTRGPEAMVYGDFGLGPAIVVAVPAWRGVGGELASENLWHPRRELGIGSGRGTRILH